MGQFKKVKVNRFATKMMVSKKGLEVLLLLTYYVVYFTFLGRF